MRRSPAAAWFASLILLAVIFTGITLSEDTGRAQSNQSSRPRFHKLSHDLGERMRGRQASTDRLECVLQLKGQPSARLNALLKRNGINVRAQFSNLSSYSVELPASVVEELASLGEVTHVSMNNRVEAYGHISSTTGVDAMRSTNDKTNSELDGTGIGITILDSGIDKAHKSFLGQSKGARVVYSRDFTGENRTDDPYGHGTHVASIAAGNGRISNAQYIGIAPNANLINLRVLNSQGVGSTSTLLSALDWVMANRATYNIRVVNMSLGILAVDSYRNDPVCMAVRRLVDAGVVVVAAAGNNGKDSAGNKIYGQIHSPGNEPAAITVGAANTFGTDERSDDTVTSYSSRGPTRSSWTDESGVKHYDNLVKPDIVAPGNKLIYAEVQAQSARINGDQMIRVNLEADTGMDYLGN